MTFVDRTKTEHSLKREWQYVQGPARETRNSVTGCVRDAGNDGKSLDDFMREANERIRERRRDGHVRRST